MELPLPAALAASALQCCLGVGVTSPVEERERCKLLSVLRNNGVPMQFCINVLSLLAFSFLGVCGLNI